MVLFLFSIAAACAVVTLAQVAASLCALASRSKKAARRATRAYSAPAHTARPFTGLPDREEVKNIYSLSDQFADRLREVVQS